MIIKTASREYHIDRTDSPEKQQVWKDALHIVMVGGQNLIGLYDDYEPGEACLYGVLRFMNLDQQVQLPNGTLAYSFNHAIFPMLYGRPAPRIQLNDVNGVIRVNELTEELRGNDGSTRIQMCTLIENEYLAIIDPPVVQTSPARSPLLVK